MFGGDAFPYGIEPNRPTLNALVQYLHEQALIAAPVRVDDLFVPIDGEADMPAVALRLIVSSRLAGSGSGIGLARAQSEDPAKFPSRTVRLIVPSSPGGPVDAVARILAEGLRAVWTEPLIVENKPGAGNSTGGDLRRRRAARRLHAARHHRIRSR